MMISKFIKKFKTGSFHSSTQHLLVNLIFFGILAVTPYQAISNNILGADLTYTCVGDDSFMVDYAIYRDCNGISFGRINIFVECKTTCERIQVISSPKPAPIDITPVCESACSRCNIPSCNIPYGFEKYVYSELVVIDDSVQCCEISFNYYTCCRNNSISTGLDGDAFFSEAFINRCLAPCNNSVQFENSQSMLSFVGKESIIDPGIYDPDNESSITDSIVCELANPMGDISTILSYSGNYSFDKPLYFYGFPNASFPSPKGFNIDTNTGVIRFTPMKIEVTVIRLKVSEFREGQKISEVNRDFTHFITISNNNPPTLYSNNFQVGNICYGDTFETLIQCDDVDVQQYLTMDWDTTLPGASYTLDTSDSKRPKLFISWPTKKSHLNSGTFYQKVIVKDNGCPYPSSSEFIMPIDIKDHIQPQITHQDLECSYYKLKPVDLNNTMHNIKITGSGNNQNFLFSSFKDQKLYLPESGQYIFKLYPVNPACGITVYDTINVTQDAMEIVLPKDTTLCEGEGRYIEAKIKNPTGLLKFDWSTGHTRHLKIYTNELFDTTEVILWVEDTLNGCFIWDTTTVNVIKRPELELGKDQFICSGRYAEIFNKRHKNWMSYNWYQLNPSTYMGNHDSLFVNQQGSYACVAINPLGLCNNYDTINLIESQFNFIKEDQICDEDYFFPLYPGAKYVLWTGDGVVQDSSGSYYINLDLVNFKHKQQYPYLYKIKDQYNCWYEDTLWLTYYQNAKIDKGQYQYGVCEDSSNVFFTASPEGGAWSGVGVKSSTGQFFPIISGPGKHSLYYNIVGDCPSHDVTEIEVFETPLVYFGSDKTSGSPPLTVHFYDSTKMQFDNIATYNWDFGDGYSSNIKNPIHTYLDTIGTFYVSLRVKSNRGCFGYLIDSFYINIAVWIDEINPSKISIYPNPAFSQLNIESEKILANVMIYNTVGELVLSKTNLNIKTFQLDLSEISKGSYILEIRDIEGRFFRKMIIKK
jgi:hypothetical protein